MSRSASEPLRQVTEEERRELQRVSRASSETRIRHQRAVALLAVSEGKSLSEAARLVGWKGHDPVTKVTRRFNSMGLRALDDLRRPGPHRRYGPAEQARILQEAQRSPDRKEDATGTWSLTLLQRALRSAPDGFPKISTFTILYTLLRPLALAGRRTERGVIPAEPSKKGKMEQFTRVKIPIHRKRKR